VKPTRFFNTLTEQGNNKMYRLLPFLICVTFIVGCGGPQKPLGMPQLYQVNVTVIQDGKPLPDATVSLIAENPNNQWSTGGTTDVSGKLTLMTYGQFRGVPEGKYKVCISKQQIVGEMDYSDPASPKGMQELFELVDLTFQSESKTTLEMEVKPNGKNNFTFDVGKSVKVKAVVPGT
jgi:hypothetical protein